MTFGDEVKAFYKDLKVPDGLPKDVKALYPFNNEATWSVIEKFFSKYYNDSNPRVLLMGINPGRFGAGLTGIGFTDPIRLEEECGISNDFEKNAELSSKFIYDVIHAYGGPIKFYSRFFISSICPIGFVKDGKNYNYYDDPLLEKAVRPFAVDCINNKVAFGCSSSIAFGIGQGKNFKFLDKLNSEHKFFNEIGVMPHPRWVMQYRLKRKEEFVDQYLQKLESIGDSN